ncbi:MAG: hypothetical protein GX868_02815 [Actinobacteria bacterium]|nr:hypothetical protein [Actinomycetota bacterium]
MSTVPAATFALQSQPPVPLPSVPASLPTLGPSEAQLNTASILAIALVVFGAGLLVQRVWLLRGSTAGAPRGRALAVGGIACLAAGAAAAAWWAQLIDISAAWTQAWWVMGGTALAIAATVATVIIDPSKRTADALARVAVGAGSVTAVVGLAWLGHARTADPVALSVASDVAHLICAAVWIGGVGVVVAASVGVGALSGTAVIELLRRFSALAAVSVAVLGLTGVTLGIRIAGSLDQLFVGGRGTLLIAKLVLAWTAVVLAGANGLVFAPKARRSGRWGSVSRTACAELLVLLAVLVVAGLLSNESPVMN